MPDITQTVVTKLELDNSSYVNNLEKQEDQQEDTNKATEEGTAATGEMTGALDSMAGSLGVNVGAMKKTVTGLGTVSKGFKTLKGAIIATGIGALIIALSSLFAWFNRTAEGQEKLALITAGLGATFDVLMDTLADLGEALFNAFENPQQAVKDLWETIKTNLINRVKAIPLLFKAIGKTIKAALDLDFDAVKESAKDVGTAVVQLNLGLDETQQKNVVGGLAEKWGEVVVESGKAVEIQRESNKLTRKQIAFITKEAELVRDISAARVQSEDSTLTTLEQLEGINEAVILTNELFGKRRELLAGQVEQLAAAQDLGHNTLEDDRELQTLRAQLIQLDTQRNDQLRGLSKRQKTLNSQAAAGVETGKEGLATQKELNDLKKIEDEETAARQLKFEEREIKAQEKLEEFKLKQEDAAASEIMAAEDRQARLIELERSRLKTQLDDNVLTLSEIELAKKESQQRINNIDKVAAKGKKELDLQVTESIVGSMQLIAGENKQVATIGAIINTAVGITRALDSPWPLNLVNAAAAGLAGAAQVSVINKQKAARGAYLRGPSHSNGGIDIEAEGGEVIINKEATAQYLPLLSAINQSVGNGVPLAARGMLVGEAQNRSAISSLPGTISEVMGQTRAVLVTEDLSVVQNRVAATESIATL